MPLRKKRTTKKRKPPVKQVEQQKNPIVIVDQLQAKLAQGNNYRCYTTSLELVSLLEDPRPVYIVMRDTSLRFWNWVNAKKGITREQAEAIRKARAYGK